MARRQLPSFVAIWKKHEQLYLMVFSTALIKLYEMNSLSGDEAEISEKLCLILNQVCFNFSKSTGREIATPCWEAPIQPVAYNELTGGKNSMRPDFTCKRVNPYANSPKEHEISLHVECKRLGSPTSPTWVLNKNYVTDGINRFDSKSHEYGKRGLSGIMIGYIISMSPKEINDEVNSFQKKYLPDNIPIIFNFTQVPPFQARQQFERKNILPNKFELIHLWVDLTKNYHVT